MVIFNGAIMRHRIHFKEDRKKSAHIQRKMNERIKSPGFVQVNYRINIRLIDDFI